MFIAAYGSMNVQPSSQFLAAPVSWDARLRFLSPRIAAEQLLLAAWPAGRTSRRGSKGVCSHTIATPAPGRSRRAAKRQHCGRDDAGNVQFAHLNSLSTPFALSRSDMSRFATSIARAILA